MALDAADWSRQSGGLRRDAEQPGAGQGDGGGAESRGHWGLESVRTTVGGHRCPSAFPMHMCAS